MALIPKEHGGAIGGRLRMAREGARLSTRDVEERLRRQGIKVSHATIGNYERGLTQPSEKILGLLAGLYKRELDWLLGTGLTLRGIRYRALKSVSVHEKKDFKLRAQAWLDAYFYIEGILKRKLENRYPRFKVKFDTSGRQLAEKIRSMYKIRDYPVTSTIRILEHFGIYVIEIGTSARIDACAGFLGNSRIVVLNESLPNDRIRLTALHELAHHLYRDCINGPGLLYEDVEKRAFEFASYMLLPEAQLERAMRLKSMVRLVQYKERFGISLAAMIYRARKSDLIPPNLYKRLWRDFGRLGFRKNEPGQVAADRPLRMEALLDAAVSDGKITFATVAQLAGTDESIVKERVFRAIGGREQKPQILDFEAYNRKKRNNL